MKKTTKHIIILATLFVVLLACKKDKLSSDHKELIGTWSSLSTMGESGNCGFVMGTMLNPNLKLVLLEKGKYQLYKEEEQIECGRLIVKNGLVLLKTLEKIKHLKTEQ